MKYFDLKYILNTVVAFLLGSLLWLIADKAWAALPSSLDFDQLLLILNQPVSVPKWQQLAFFVSIVVIFLGAVIKFFKYSYFKIYNKSNHLTDFLLNHSFTLIYNPTKKISKSITFLPNGEIGEGRNLNEHTWRISKNHLEILNSNSDVFSIFEFNPVTQVFHHTNCPSTKSVKSQFIEVT